MNILYREIKKRAPHSEKCALLYLVSYSVAQTVYVNEVRRARRDATKRSAHHNTLLLIIVV